ncbi:MAG TPA: serine hydrolase domain-containing protein [Steroidobacteraceae bacterium]|nr:serine hydrolase domain-containing protein [Steroidobacteraceae bacterium]
MRVNERSAYAGLLLATAVATLGAGSGATQPSATLRGAMQPGTTELPPTVLQLLDDQRVPAITWAIVRDGAIASGARDRALPASAAPSATATFFHAASVTKPVVAVTAMRLARAGRLDLDAPVTRYLREPAFTMLGERGLTTRQLLQHRSGLKDFERLDWLDPGRAASALREAFNDPATLAFEKAPGGDFAYANLNYSLVGLVIENVTGEPFAQSVAKLALQPFGAPGARLSCQDVAPSALAAAHVLSSAGESARSSLLPFNRAHSPSGGLCITATELAAWGARLLACESDDAPLTCAELESMFPRAQERYGLGWYDEPIGAERAIWHDGSDAGYAAALLLVPARRLAIAVMTNFEFASAGVMAKTLAARELGTRYAGKVEFPSRERWPEYAGTYYHAELRCARVTASERGLEVLYQTSDFPYELTRTRLMPKPEWDEGYFIGAFRGKLIWFGDLAEPTRSFLFMSSKKFVREAAGSTRCDGLRG